MKRKRIGLLVVIIGVLSVWGAGCSRPDTDIRAAVQILAEEQGEVALRGIDRLRPHGVRVLPHIETALQTAPAAGRRNLVLAMRRLGHGEAAALLGHLAGYDEDAGVRMEARWTLRAWVAAGGERGKAAAAALRKADEVAKEDDEGIG